MNSQEQTIEALRAALAVSPENVPLRKHLADTLLGIGRCEEAVVEYREALRCAPDDVDLKISLACAYYNDGKYSHATVVVEELLALRDTPPTARALYARLLLRDGEVDRAIRQYKQAISEAPGLRDEDLEQRLGVDAGETQEVVDGRVRAFQGDDEDDGIGDLEIEHPGVNFADVGGMEGVKDEIRMKIIHPLQHADMYAAYGKKIGGGILLYGPPGCGKTHLARATAGEVSAGFLAVGVNDVLDMWIGQSERRLHDIFEQARERKPCVLFFDEVDALGAKRTDMRQNAGRHLINQFLAELDGVKTSNEGVLILGATNAPWHLDGAFRRPGRFDRVLFVPPPDEPARAEILRILMKGKPTSNVDVERVAQKAADFSGADLKAVIDVAVEAKLREAMKTGVPQPLTTKDLTTAAKQVRPSAKEWFNTAKNHALYANDAGLYDDVLKYLRIK